MLNYDIPQTIRAKYLEEKEMHDSHCEDGYIIYINQFTQVVNELKCPYCQRFNKEVYND